MVVVAVGHHAQEDDVAFAALEDAGVAAGELAPRQLHRVAARAHLLVDQLRLFRPEQRHHAERAPGHLRVAQDGLDLGHDAVGLGRVVALGRAVAAGNVDVDQRRVEPFRGARHPHRLDEILVEHAVAVGDDWLHAAEMLAQHDLGGREHRRGDVVQRHVGRQHGLERLAGQEAPAQVADLRARHECGFGRHLLVVADHQDLLAAQDRRQRPQIGLAGLVDDHEIKSAERRRQRFRHPRVAHDPARHRGLGVDHGLLRIAPVARGVHAGALAELADRGAVGFECAQHVRPGVLARGQPGRLRHQLLVQARQRRFQFAPARRQGAHLVTRVDAVEVAAQARPGPGFKPARREYRVVAGIVLGHARHPRRQARGAAGGNRRRERQHFLEVVRQRLDPGQFAEQRGVAALQRAGRQLGVAEIVFEQRAQA